MLIESEIDETRSETQRGVDALRPRALGKIFPRESGDGDVVVDVLRALTVSLPNDLSRLIFLATLRDNNSGHYFHPDLARRFSERVADRAMLACHQRIYKQVVALSIEDLTDQLDVYVTTVPAPRERIIESWTKLKAYRATIPIDTDPISAEIFFMKVEVVSCLSWKWRKRSSVKITERTYEEGTEAFHPGRKSSHLEAASR
ncbi:MAG: hypothetical protein WCF26_07865, partial [Candidatus Sulfotelmatobacter sp.]